MAKNTGEVDLTNVKIVDQLPAYYSNATEKVEAPSEVTGSIVKGGELTIAKLPVGQSATITVSYVVKSADELECGDTTVKNQVSGTTDQDQTEDDNNNNETTTVVTNECEPEPEPKPGYDISKSVDKTTAAPGDTLTYTIVVKNTGEVDLTNIKVVDKLPAYYSHVEEKVEAPSEVTGSIVKDGEITIAKLPVDQSATITISYVIKGTDSLDCGNTEITNQVSGTTDQDDSEDNGDNNQVTTVVTRECTPITPPEENEDTPAPEQPQQTPETPTVIAQTGAGETVATVIGLGAIAAAVTAYIRSRKYAK